jgi:hypothetical protein
MMTKQEAKVSTFFLASIAAGLLGGGLTRLLTHRSSEAGSVLALIFGTIALIVSIVHVGLED